MSVTQPAAAKIRIVKWAKLAEPPAVNEQQMELCTMGASPVPVEQEPSRWSAQVKSSP